MRTILILLQLLTINLYAQLVPAPTTIPDTLPTKSGTNVWTGGNEFQSYFKIHSRTLNDGDTLDVNDILVYVNLSVGEKIHMPDPAQSINKLILIWQGDADGGTIEPYGLESFIGYAGNIVLAPYSSYLLTFNGTDWVILSKIE